MFQNFNLPESICDLLVKEHIRVKEQFATMDHIAKICEDDVLFTLETKAILPACGLEGHDFIWPTNYKNVASSGRLLAGKCFPLQGVKFPLSLIILRLKYPDDCNPGFVAGHKLHTLYHELGHADHFRKGLYIEKYDARKAEKYAGDFVRKHLKELRIGIRCQDNGRVFRNFWEFLAANGARGQEYTFKKSS